MDGYNPGTEKYKMDYSVTFSCRQTSFLSNE